jgi:ribosomal protein S18 acetylase RimI-like enzyme
MTPSPAAEVRRAAVRDLPALARFIAALNALPASECLHCAERTAAGVRGALRAEFGPGADDWADTFAVATRPDDGGGADFPAIVGAMGCQLDPAAESGWLWGPWITDETDWSALGPPLLAQMLAMLPRSVRRVDAFLRSDNARGLRFLQSHGFSLRQTTHIYVAPRRAWLPSSVVGGDEDGDSPFVGGELRAAHEIAFARLHAESFPAAESARAEDLLAGRDEEHRIFTVADGLRLLGYACASINRAPREGFIDYLAVRPSARGKGIGGRLLRAAQRWIFEERQLPQAALCVSDWRSDARRLYERAGFALHASGVGARRFLR